MGRENEHDFARALRGYNTEEVDSYIDGLEDRIRALENEKIDLAERAVMAKTALDDSNTKRGVAEKVLADAQKEAEQIIADAKARAESIEAEARAIAAKTENDGKLKADALIGAALLEEKKINERLEKSIVEKERIYNAFCDKHNEFKNSIFTMYASHISALEDILANKVPESYVIAEEKKSEPVPAPEKIEVPREETVAPIAPERPEPRKDADVAKNLGIKVSRESGRGETIGSIMRELDEIKGRIAEKEKKKY